MSSGKKRLIGPEAVLFRAGVAELAQNVNYADEQDDEGEGLAYVCSIDFPPDSNSRMLRKVGRALLEITWPQPRLTAIVEATVATIFKAIGGKAQYEIDEDWREELFEFKTTRRLLLDVAAGWPRSAEEPPLPDVNCDEFAEWQPIIAAFESEILWDDDFEDAGRYVDMPPEKGNALKDHMDIEREYFTATIADPDAAAVQAILADFEALVGHGFVRNRPGQAEPHIE